MGPQQSAPGLGVEATVTSKTCYYELIGVDQNATDDQIKKAYRKKALELHPDRNINDVEEATRKFAEVQTAYEILSDPHERAWYDSHRDAILNDTDGNISSGVQASFHNVTFTPTEEIMNFIGKFDSKIAFDDGPTGFFGMLHEMFKHLALEEATAAKMGDHDYTAYAAFGLSTDAFDTVVKPFYTSWAGFSTLKSFFWKDKYKLPDAPDRRVRRLMEKENKKCRENAIREFNHAVRFLLAFVRRRDPRYISNAQTDVERQKQLREAAASQAARSRAANQKNVECYSTPGWIQSQNNNTQNEYLSENDQDPEVEILECVVCSKFFKSLQQLGSHEQSKKHRKALQLLRKRLQEEDIEIGMGPDLSHGSGRSDAAIEATATTDLPGPDGGDPNGSHLVAEAERVVTTKMPKEGQPSEDALHSYTQDEAEMDEYAPRNLVESRLNKNAVSSSSDEELGDGLIASLNDVSVDASSSNSSSKARVAKARRRKKVACQSSVGGEIKCHVCFASFASRTKLFDHIRQEEHAVATLDTGALRKHKKGTKK